MKTKEELNAIKEKYDDVKEKLAELTDDELSLVSGGVDLNSPEPTEYFAPEYALDYPGPTPKTPSLR